MLQVSAHQLQIFETEADLRFRSAAALHLRRCFPDETAGLGNYELDARIARVCARARSYGLSAEADLLRLLDVDLAFGERFEERPGFAWARALLEERECRADVRMDRLCARLVSDDDDSPEPVEATPEELENPSLAHVPDPPAPTAAPGA